MCKVNAQYIDYPKREYRAVWLTTIENLDWPKTRIKSPEDINKQKNELMVLLDSLESFNINTVLLQTRIRGDLIYPSEIEPFSAVFTGKSGKYPGYDPLAFAIEECHKRGMQLHAWLVTLPLGRTGHVQSLGRNSVKIRHPKLCRLYKGSWYMEPGEPETAEYLCRLVTEITDRYDVDGIHLDYIRYPDRPENYPDNALFRRYGKGLKLADWRRENITGIVRKIYKTVKKIKPWVRVSCAPLGKHDDLSNFRSKGWNARNTVFQDAQKWLNEGIMDVLFPMMYFKDNDFYPFALDWKENASGRHVAPGLGVYRLLPEEGDWELDEISRQMFTSRRNGMDGTAVFRVEHLLKDNKNISSFMKLFNRYPALLPAMSWMDDKQLESPCDMIGERSGDTLRLKWTGVVQKENIPKVRYNVYRSRVYPVDIEKAENIVALSLKDTTFVWNDVPDDFFWAVTAVNAYEKESVPVVWKEERPCSGLYRDSVCLPEVNEWGTRLLLKDMTGRLLFSTPYGCNVKVDKLPPGCYRLETMSGKGVISERRIFVR